MQERLRILVVGQGGREHALTWKLSQSSLVDAIHIAPGNGGTASALVSNINIPVDDFAGLLSHSKQHDINLVVVGPEAPLVAGIEDYFRSNGVRVFGPSKAAARLEGSKAFSKDFMQQFGIPTAAYQNFSDYESARKYLDSITHDVVIKADGLAAGKGVYIPTSKQEAQEALKEIMVDRQFGNAGNGVTIEEFLEGEELSVLTFSDGYTIKSLPPAQDHKRIFDGDRGPNTGGMGCYAPTRVASKELIAEIDRTIVQPTIDSIRTQGIPFRGMLFTGLMITKSGPKVLEYNVRGGDPETQTLLPLLSKDTDLAMVMVACAEGWLGGVDLKIEPRFSATVVASAEGYPGSYAKNRSIKLEATPKDTIIFHAGTSMADGELITTGGRVISATATSDTLEDAVALAYRAMKTIQFDGMHYRKDIAHRAFSHAKSRRDSDAPLTYAGAGVSVDRGNEAVQRIKALVKSTARPGADASIGGFGGALSLVDAGYEKPPLIVMCIDGIGTKLKIAFALDKHDTIGIDLVAMNTNDLIVQGAEPLMFVDYYGCSILEVDVLEKFVEGVVKGCIDSGCALVGGETAELPGIYKLKEYDAAGTAMGAIDVGRGKTPLPKLDSMVEGDVLLGLASNGAHSNGFSLINRIMARKGLALTDSAPWDPEKSVGLSLLTPTRIYVRSLLKAIDRDLVKGMAHITGGGLTENVPRMLPDHLAAEIDVQSWRRPKLFDWLQQAGKVDAKEMARTFNNGVGMVLVISAANSAEVLEVLQEHGEVVYKMGKLVKREPSGTGCLLLHLDSWSGH